MQNKNGISNQFGNLVGGLMNAKARAISDSNAMQISHCWKEQVTAELLPSLLFEICVLLTRKHVALKRCA